jgi:hypothetical protein
VGSITVLELYGKYHDHWFLEEAYEPLLRWNRWGLCIAISRAI